MYSKMERLCPDRKKNELSDGQQQQAISVYFFLEGLAFRVGIRFWVTADIAF